MINQLRIARQAKCIFADLKRRGFLDRVEYLRSVSNEYDVVEGVADTYAISFIDAHFNFRSRRELSNQVQAGDTQIVFLRDSLDFEPCIDDLIRFNYKTYTIISPSQQSPNVDPTIVLTLRAQ